MLAKVQMQALDNAVLIVHPRMARIDAMVSAAPEDDAVCYTDDASTARGLERPGTEEPGPGIQRGWAWPLVCWRSAASTGRRA